MLLEENIEYSLIFIRLFYYLSRKFINIYQEIEKLTVFYLIALICIRD